MHSVFRRRRRNLKVSSAGVIWILDISYVVRYTLRVGIANSSLQWNIVDVYRAN